MLILQSSEALENSIHGGGYASSGSKVVAFLIFLHPLRCQNNEDRILVQEVVDQDAANFIIKPLFLLTPILALGVIQLIDNS